MDYLPKNEDETVIPNYQGENFINVNDNVVQLTWSQEAHANFDVRLPIKYSYLI